MTDGRTTGARTADAGLRRALGWTLPAQIAWAALAAIWNVAGVYLIASGQRAPGPTATLAAAGVLVALALALMLLVSRLPVAYLVLSVVAGLMALAAVVNAFVQDPALWPSELWRWAGIVLNGVGFVAAAAAVVACIRWKSIR